MKYWHLFFAFITMALPLSAQTSKKAMDPSVYATWKRINDTKISDDGLWVTYQQTAEELDPTLHLYSVAQRRTQIFNRAKDYTLDAKAGYLIYTAELARDSSRTLQRRKVKKKDLPKDTLCIYQLATGETTYIPDLKGYKTIRKGSDYLIYQLTPHTPPKDTSGTAPELKKESKDNGSRLIVRQLSTGHEDTLRYIVDYAVPREGYHLAAVSTGDDSLLVAGLYHYDFGSRRTRLVQASEGDFSRLSFDDQGTQLAYLLDRDTTKALIRPMEVYRYPTRGGQAHVVIDNSSTLLPDGHIVSPHRTPSFSTDGSVLYFGVSPNPVLQDTALLDDEIVDVEVWTYQDQMLYTQQEVRADRLKKKNYIWQYDTKSKKIIPLGRTDIPTVNLPREGQPNYYLGYNNEPYLKYISWLGHDYKDLYRIDSRSGQTSKLAEQIWGWPRLSPNGKYATWFSSKDSTWQCINLEKGQIKELTNNDLGTFYEAWNDRPMAAGSAGFGGWTAAEKKVLLYDHYDVWMADPNKDGKLKRLTQGRENNTRYRLMQLDEDVHHFDLDKRQMLSIFNYTTKESGLAWLEPNGQITRVAFGPYSYSWPEKAKEADVFVYSQSNLQTFPDLLVTNASFSQAQQISDANPQMADYRGGQVELITWTSPSGVAHEGMLYTPEGLDPNKKYPLIVNFYEKSADRLHRHRAPYAHRSTINYSYYLSKGYVIFNPDVHYRVGYPGASCEESVLSGLDEVLKRGYIDTTRMGLQGHSWGGYQIADLLTRTDRFACAESGAPVVNMVSAYGGIRWGSGMSRMFQYEKTQSRLGATLWERPDLYLENSPIFNMDKTNTPVLILHNDEDGAVPWYQGIEYFVALRRLGKPAWFLNYNKEPHWPVKWRNRKDFNIRMEQFFDHYLMGKEMPLWMKEGVPAIEKGINQRM